MTPPGSRITTVGALRGATIAVNVRNNIGTILIGTALEEHNVPLSSVHLVPMPFPAMTAALSHHQVDAAWIPEPFLSSTEEQIGGQEIFDLDQGATANFPIVGYAVTRSWEQKYPRTAAAFTRALEQGQAVADSVPAAVEQTVPAYLGVSPETAAIMALPQFPLGVNRPRLQRVADLMQQFGLLGQAYNVTQMTG